MCVILSVYQKTPRKNFEILKKIEQFSESNRDGAGIVGLSLTDNRLEINRKLKLKDIKVEKILANFEIVNIHLRNATSGKVNESNVHFWRKGNWLFCHNGVLSDYEKLATEKDKEASDSLILFNKMIETKCLNDKDDISIKKINKLFKTLSFWGRLVIINVKTKRVYYFGDFKAYMIDDNTLIVSTAEINFGSVKNFLGLEFENERTDIKKKEIEGIFYFNPKQKKLKWLCEDFDTSYSSYGSSSSCYDGEVKTYNPVGYHNVYEPKTCKTSEDEERYWKKFNRTLDV